MQIIVKTWCDSVWEGNRCQKIELDDQKMERNYLNGIMKNSHYTLVYVFIHGYVYLSVIVLVLRLNHRSVSLGIDTLLYDMRHTTMYATPNLHTCVS